MEEQYQPLIIEQPLREQWEQAQTFKAVEDLNKEKFYCLTMFPYPSGRLHMGHVRVYAITDVIARYQRMLGKNVLHPMGWDAFGLPAENAAIQHKVPPAQWTYQNIEEMRRQMKLLGLSYDWQREITTCKPEYYRWEQWLFVQLFKKGLAYRKNAVVNWDPVDQTVLANEQVVDGCGWRSGAPVERKEIPQWFLKITAYANELLEKLDELPDWPEQVKTMQRNWIGRSEGLIIQFEVPSNEPPIEIFTTRPDTLMGATYLALSPEHPFVAKLAKENPALQTFVEEQRRIQVSEAAMATIEKKGMALPIKAIHPITGQEMPIWVANFVLMEYGTGAVMSVPAHDQRDFEFAQQYQLPILQVIKPTNNNPINLSKAAYTDQGMLINSGRFDGLDFHEAFEAIEAALVEQNKGRRQTHFRLRDWGVSRQRYWGCPIPIIYCKHCGTLPVPEEDLPVVLPEDVSFSGYRSPLKEIPAFYETTCPECKQPATRETDTFDTFVESSWYYTRYACKKQDKAILDDRVKYWVPVDQYVGGIEHAVMHLLYARFFHKILRDESLLNSDEPFTRLMTQGMVLKDGAKMSKSKGNIVDPLQMIERYGVDTIRLFMIFASPPEQSLEWSDTGIEGAHRFLKRLWHFAYTHEQRIKKLSYAMKDSSQCTIDWHTAPAIFCDIRREMNEILKQSRNDYERQQFNTVVSGCMKLMNLLQKTAEIDLPDSVATQDQIIHKTLSVLLRLLAPIAPFITEHLWQNLCFGQTILQAPWPKVATDALLTKEIQLVVQINGKLRGKITVVSSTDEETIKNLVLNDAHFQKFLAGKSCKKVVVVPGKLVNIVV